MARVRWLTVEGGELETQRMRPARGQDENLSIAVAATRPYLAPT